MRSTFLGFKIHVSLFSIGVTYIATIKYADNEYKAACEETNNQQTI